MTEDSGRIPPEIVEEVLIKLPVKSLKRICCVSKSWQSIISDQTFVRKHLSLSHNKTLVLSNPVKPDYEKFSFFHLFSLQRVPKINKFRCPLGTNYWLLLATCDGLLCICSHESVYIWNPSLKNYFREIPIPIDNRLCYYSFGYDLRTDDYKLLRVSRTGLTRTSVTEVYSLKLETWKQLGDFPQNYLPIYKSVFFNGSIYWLALRCDLRLNTLNLFSFDLSDNKYREITLPEYSPNPHYFVNVNLGVLKGMLCLLAELDPSLVLWAMKDFSDPKPWTKIFYIPLELDFHLDILDVKLFHMYENGEVLMGTICDNGTELVICKDNAVSFREIVLKEQSFIRCGFVHVESMVSPRPINVISCTSEAPIVENADKELLSISHSNF